MAGSRAANGRVSSSSCFRAETFSVGRLHNPLAGALAAVRLTSMAMKNPATMMPLIVPAMSASKTTVDIRSALQLRHPGDQQVADEDQETGDAEQHVAHDRARHRCEVARHEDVKAERQQDGQSRDDGGRRA